MPARFFTLLNPFRIIDDVPQWLIWFPPWLESSAYDLRSGILLAEKWNPKTFAFARTEPPGTCEKPDFPSVVGEWQAVSERLARDLITLAPGAFEFLPFRTRTTTGDDVTEGYALLHYLKWIDGVDKRRSRLMAGESEFRQLQATCEDYYLETVVLNRRKLVEPICRIRGWSEYHLFREDIVDVLTANGFTGLRFEEVEVA